MNEKMKVLNLLPRKFRVLGYFFIMVAILLLGMDILGEVELITKMSG